jgi:gliding motility-associated-like protein
MARITATGVNSPFTYRWSNNSADDSLGNLPEGIYYVTVTDNNNCLSYDTAIVSQPSQIVLTAAINDLQCNGENSGSINLNISGGVPGYNYNWSGNQATPNIDSLSAGDYSVTVTDNHNCATTDLYRVIEPSLIILSAGATPVVCNGDSNGIAAVTASGGTPFYSYQWDAAAGNQITSSAINLSAGIYDVVVTDANNCTATISAAVSEPQMLVVVIDSFANALCQGESSGFASASASGGINPITYLWNNNPPANGGIISGVGSGTYEVTASDGNGCTATASVILNEPPPLSVTIFPKDTTITYGDSVTLHAVHSPAGIATAYDWEPSNFPMLCVAPCADPTVIPYVSTTFSVYMTVPGSTCSASAQAFVDVMFNNDIQAPNVFSPDGDGVNDEFEVFYSPSLTGIIYKIFNRWGEKLFETSTIGEFWDGTFHGALQNPGVYVYWVEGEFLNGEKKQFKGSFTLLR